MLIYTLFDNFTQIFVHVRFFWGIKYFTWTRRLKRNMWIKGHTKHMGGTIGLPFFGRTLPLISLFEIKSLPISDTQSHRTVGT